MSGSYNPDSRLEFIMDPVFADANNSDLPSVTAPTVEMSTAE